MSIGITVDSYIVYFERLKDEARSGRTVRTSVDRGFQSAFRTVLAADAVSLLGAVILYELSVGPVQGFALFLGISTILDVVVTYFFTRPFVILLGRSSAAPRPGHGRGERAGRDRRGTDRARRDSGNGTRTTAGREGDNGNGGGCRRRRRPLELEEAFEEELEFARGAGERRQRPSAPTPSSASTAARPPSTSSATANGGSASRR